MACAVCVCIDYVTVGRQIEDDKFIRRICAKHLESTFFALLQSER